MRDFVYFLSACGNMFRFFVQFFAGGLLGFFAKKFEMIKCFSDMHADDSNDRS